MWEEGTIEVAGSKLGYWLKRYGDNSQFGIEGGRISKLMIKRGNEVVCSYDRGWDVKPSDPATEIALDFLLKS